MEVGDPTPNPSPKGRGDLLSLIQTGGKLSFAHQLRLTLLLAAPAVVAHLSSIVMQYIDAAMVGSLGRDASASIGLMATSTWLFWGMCSAVSMGFAVQVAHRIGAADQSGAQSVLRQSLLVSVAYGLLLGVIGVAVADALPRWLGGGEEITGGATVYFTIFALSLPVLQMESLAGAMLRCSGNTFFPGMVCAAACLLDVVFNALLIFPTHTLWGITIPGAGLGVAGAALGTALAQLVAAVVMWWHLWRSNPQLHLRGSHGSYMPQRQCFGEAVRIGAPLGGEHLTMCGAQVISTAIVAPLGPVAIAANAFAVTAESLCYMPGYGLSEAATTLVGQCVGAKRPRLANRFAGITVVAGMLIMGLMGVVMYFAAPLMMGVITPVEEIRAAGVEVLRIEAWAEPMFAAAIVAYGVFVGAGRTVVPSLMNIFSMWAVRLTLAALLAPTMGLRGVWIAMAVELCFRGTIFLFSFFKIKLLRTTAVVGALLVCGGVCASPTDSTAWADTIQTTVVTATRSPKLLLDVPVPTRVIGQDDIRRADVTDVARLLEQELPGLEFSWAMSKEVTLNMGGFGGNSILFLVDGERLAGETMNNPDYQRLSLQNVERIEIVRGAASSLYGAGAVGGVVNIITRKETRPLSLSLDAQTGTHQSHRLGGSIGFRKWGVANTLQGQYTHTGQYTMSPFNGAQTNTLVANSNYTVNVSDRLVFQPMERLALTARAGYFFRQRDYDPTTNNRYRDFSGGLRGTYSFAKNHELELAYAFDQYDKSDYSLLTGADRRDYSNVQNSLKVLYTSHLPLRSRLRLVTPSEFTPRTSHLTLTAGADVMRDYLQSYMFAGSGGRSQMQADGFVQADYEPTKQWEVVGALRYDYYSRSSASSMTGKLAARFRPRHDLTLRASYSGGFRAPTLKEMYMNFDMAGIFMIYGNHDLRPERSHNWEANVEWRPHGWELTAQLHHSQVRNRATTIWDASAPGLYGNQGAMRYQNIPRLSIFGLDANVQKRFAQHWQARLSYALCHVHVPAGQPYADDTRPHSLTARLTYDFNIARTPVALGWSGRYLSPMSLRELDDTYSQLNDFKTHYPGYCIVKFTAQATLPKGFSISLSADNLLGYRPSRYTYYSPKTTGTVFTATLSYKL